MPRAEFLRSPGEAFPAIESESAPPATQTQAAWGVRALGRLHCLRYDASPRPAASAIFLRRLLPRNPARRGIREGDPDALKHQRGSTKRKKPRNEPAQVNSIQEYCGTAVGRSTQPATSRPIPDTRSGASSQRQRCPAAPLYGYRANGSLALLVRSERPATDHRQSQQSEAD